MTPNRVPRDDRPHRMHRLQGAIAAAFIAIAVVLVVRNVEAPQDVRPLDASLASTHTAGPAPGGQVFVPTTGVTFGEIEPLPPQF